jgi:hypothetical protein
MQPMEAARVCCAKPHRADQVFGLPSRGKAAFFAGPEAAMQRVYAMTDFSIRRGCGFAALGVVTTMAALSFEPVMSFRVGGVLTAAVAFALWVQAQTAPRRNVLRSEIWMLLRQHAKDLRPELAKQLLPPVMRERYLWHATAASAVAVALWLMAGVLYVLRA